MLELRRVREIAVTGQPVERGDIVREELRLVEQAQRPRRQGRADVERRVEARPGEGRGVAERVVAHPEPRARSLRLVGVVAGRVERRPAPGPDARDVQLGRNLLRRECLPLDDVEPLRERLQAFAAAGLGRRAEGQHHPEPVRRHADLDQLLEPVAHGRAQAAAALHRTLLGDRRAGEVDLRHEVCDLGGLLPPRVGGGVVRVGVAREEQEGPRAAVGEPLQEREHVRAVLRGGRCPRGWQLRPEELVLGHQRVVAAGRRHGRCEELVGARLDRRGIGRLRRGADAVVQVEVEVDGLRALGAELRRDEEVRRGADDPGPREDRRPERNTAVGVVDPERLRRREAARKRQLRCGRLRGRRAPAGGSRREREHANAEHEDPSHGARCSKAARSHPRPFRDVTRTATAGVRHAHDTVTDHPQGDDLPRVAGRGTRGAGLPPQRSFRRQPSCRKRKESAPRVCRGGAERDSVRQHVERETASERPPRRLSTPGHSRAIPLVAHSLSPLRNGSRRDVGVTHSCRRWNA